MEENRIEIYIEIKPKQDNEPYDIPLENITTIEADEITTKAITPGKY